MLQSHFSTRYHVEPYLTAEIKFTRDAMYFTNLQQSHCLRTSHMPGIFMAGWTSSIYVSSGSTFNSVSRPYPGQDLNLIKLYFGVFVAGTIG